MTTYAEGKYSIRITQGDDWTQPFTISTQLPGGAVTPVDLTGQTIVFLVRPSYTTGNLVSATITPVDLSLGQFIVSMSNTQTNTLPAGALVFQLTTTDAGVTTTRGFGNFIVRARIQSA